MTKQPTEMTIAKLEVLIMPNGEILSLGKRVGYFKEFAKSLSDPKDAITNQPIKQWHQYILELSE